MNPLIILFAFILWLALTCLPKIEQWLKKLRKKDVWTFQEEDEERWEEKLTRYKKGRDE